MQDDLDPTYWEMNEADPEEAAKWDRKAGCR